MTRCARAVRAKPQQLMDFGNAAPISRSRSAIRALDAASGVGLAFKQGKYKVADLGLAGAHSALKPKSTCITQ